MPPVREASTNPSAATVLPAPVACSNQKRLSALGSSGALGLDVLVELGLVLPVDRLLVVVGLAVLERPRRRPRRPGIAAGRERRRLGRLGAAPPLAPLPLPLRWASASSAVSVPDSASTWWADSTAPSARCGSSSDSSRSSPSSSENLRRQSIEGRCSPASISASAASSARRRAEPGASASSSVSPSYTKRSRVNSSARAIAAGLGNGVESPIEEIDVEMRPGIRSRGSTSERLRRLRP